MLYDQHFQQEAARRDIARKRLELASRLGLHDYPEYREDQLLLVNDDSKIARKDDAVLRPIRKYTFHPMPRVARRSR